MRSQASAAARQSPRSPAASLSGQPGNGSAGWPRRRRWRSSSRPVPLRTGPVRAFQQQLGVMARELGAPRQPGVLDVGEAGRHQPQQHVGAGGVLGRGGQRRLGSVGAPPHQQAGQRGQRLVADEAGVGGAVVEHRAEARLRLRPLASRRPQPESPSVDHVREQGEVPVAAVGLRLVELRRPPRRTGPTATAPRRGCESPA